jgi:hypothetical protein
MQKKEGKDEVTNKIDIKRNLHLKDDVMLGQWRGVVGTNNLYNLMS